MSDAQAPGSSTVEPRVPASAVPWITGVRLVPGDVVDLVNISKSGALVEGRTRLVPGTSLAVQLDYSGTAVRAKGKVVRCQVSSISDGALRYHSGIEFEHELETLDPPGSAATHAVPPTPQAAEAAPAQPVAAPAQRVVRNRW